MGKLARWFDQIKRRNVLRAAALYVGSIWALAQGIAQLAPIFGIPDWAIRWFVWAGAIGFPFWLAFAWFYEFTPEGLRRETEVAQDAGAVHARGRRLDIGIIGVLTLAVVLLITNQFVLRGDATSQANAVAIKNIARAGEKSIAVLPLLNATGDPRQQYFSDGLSENLIDVLSTIRGLRVSARASSFLFRNSKDTPQDIGAKLAVTYLLTGSVQRSADKIRVRAEMVDARDGSIIWTKQFSRDNRDLFELQDELSRQIAEVLKVDLLSSTGAVRGYRPPSENIEAYNAFSRGNYFSDLGSEVDTKRAIKEFEHATSLDSRYAVAWSALSKNWTSLAALYLSGDEASAAYAQAKTTGDKALALAPDLGDPHVARGWLLENTMDWNGAMFEYQRALELSPSNLQTRFSVATMQGLQGRLSEAVKKAGEAIRSSPLSPNWWNWYSTYLAALGRLDEAEAAIRKSLALRPQGNSAWAQLAIIEIQRGDAKAAMAAAINEPEGPWRAIARTMALQIGPDRRAADDALTALIKDYGDVAAYQVAQVYALRREDKAVFEWLERARITRDPGVGNTLVDPLVMRYKHDPRLAAFCSKVGLPVPTVSETVGI